LVDFHRRLDYLLSQDKKNSQNLDWPTLSHWTFHINTFLKAMDSITTVSACFDFIQENNRYSCTQIFHIGHTRGSTYDSWYLFEICSSKASHLTLCLLRKRTWTSYLEELHSHSLPKVARRSTDTKCMRFDEIHNKGIFLYKKWESDCFSSFRSVFIWSQQYICFQVTIMNPNGFSNWLEKVMWYGLASQFYLAFNWFKFLTLTRLVSWGMITFPALLKESFCCNS
jgi:hypothetical protein